MPPTFLENLILPPPLAIFSVCISDGVPVQPPKKCTILVYMTLNGKGGLTGCGLHGYSLVSVLFLTGQSNTAGCF